MYAGVFRVRLVMLSCLLLTVVVLGLFINDFVSMLNVETAFAKENLIRLHVIANSNSPADQDLKLLVRDAILEETSQVFSGVTTKEEAKILIEQNQDRVVEAARKVIAEKGYNYDVTLAIGNFAFPSKAYGSVVLPEGEYDAIQVKIGNAEGNNWWCVLFPPLCFSVIEDGTLESSLVSVNHDSEASGIAFRSKLWDRLQETRYAEQLRKWWQASAATLSRLGVD